ncbi:MAG: hypothetical protein ACFCVE_14610 [Phycisphaerae bacterium]
MTQAMDVAKEQGKLAADAARDAASDIGHEAKERGNSIFESRRDMAAEEVGHFAKAISKASETLREEGDERVADHADFAARKLDETAEYLRNCKLDDVVNGVSRATRRHPELVIGGLFVAGLAAMRLLRSSARDEDQSDSNARPGTPIGSRYDEGLDRLGGDRLNPGYGSGTASTYGAGAYGTGASGAGASGAGSYNPSGGHLGTPTDAPGGPGARTGAGYPSVTQSASPDYSPKHTDTPRDDPMGETASAHLNEPTDEPNKE